MGNTKSAFIREYQRKSKSPWEDHSTVLLLADFEFDDDENIKLSFTQYVYQHRDSAGRVLGISVSKSILEDNPEFDSQYLTGIDMYITLLLLKEDIQGFCGHFASEFEAIYGLPPQIYFEATELHWAEKLNETL
ncbi:hypothetical protein L2729_11895 [Shewanella gelidimarina]|uniref:hypothetical protein n=1 Tax=Shewanella gelidimarina TaxID=56813 RepID=UPI00200C6CFB|nr:hypothetical protein [Shewanella gelidimarina]MCL1058688.1 hypothetical protein [Shewanella gelidimarina]